MSKKLYPIVKGLILLYFILLYSSCNTNDENVLRIAVASNLRYAISELSVEFEKETGIKLEMSVASSGKLTAQIQNGAPFDIFLSANKKYPDFLYENGFSTNMSKLFCSAVLVFWVSTKSAFNGNINDIVSEKFQKIAIANPKNAPFGMATIELLKNSLIYDSVKTKIIFAENVSQISQYVLNNNVDGGFTSKSIVLSPKLQNKGKWFNIDENLYTPVSQYILLLKNGEKKDSAILFYNFIDSKKAKKILKKFGYKTE